MISIHIDPFIIERCPKLNLDVLQCRVTYTPYNDDLWTLIDTTISAMQKKLDMDDIVRIPAIHDAREGYKALGKEPSRYRLSAEALSRRIIQGKGLYKVNTIIDILNLISIKSGISIGGYDADKIRGQVFLSEREDCPEYQAIGRGILNIDNLPVLFDDSGPFGNPTSDSVRTSVTDHTTNFLMVFFNFGGDVTIKTWLHESKELLERYAEAKDISIHSKYR
jgi:DNA/RNA-binding domain of Phe-tRNA-synthetase-like protein